MASPAINEKERRSLGSDLNPMDFVASLRIVVDAETIRVTAPEGLHSGFEVSDVLFGPFDLCPNTDQSI